MRGGEGWANNKTNSFKDFAAEKDPAGRNKVKNYFVAFYFLRKCFLNLPSSGCVGFYADVSRLCAVKLKGGTINVKYNKKSFLFHIRYSTATC